MTWKPLNLVIVPFIILFFLFSLQVFTQLNQIRQLPAPGWSRAMESSPPILTSVAPYIQETKPYFDIFSAHKSVVTHTQIDTSLNVLKQNPYPVEGTVTSIIWGKGSTFAYEAGHSLYYYSQKKSRLIAKKWDHATNEGDKIIYSNSFHLYEFNPSLRKTSEIAGFAAPVSSLSSVKGGQTLMVTTYQKKTNQYSFFLLNDKKEFGYQVHKLGWIKPKSETLTDCQITQTASHYFMVISFKNHKGETLLESVQVPTKNVAQGSIGQPKAHPFLIKSSGRTLTHLYDLHLSEQNGTPSLLFVNGATDQKRKSVFVAEPGDKGAWNAAKRTASITFKSHPAWLDASHQLFTWTTPKTGSLNLVQFSSHDPKMAEKSLQVQGRDLVQAINKTHQNIGSMGRFLFLLLLFGLPSLIVYLILAIWTNEFRFSKPLILGSGLIFLIAEIDLTWHVLNDATGLPNYLSFSFSPVVYSVGSTLLATLMTKLLCPNEWPKKAQFTYGLTLVALWMTFLIGPYF